MYPRAKLIIKENTLYVSICQIIMVPTIIFLLQFSDLTIYARYDKHKISIGLCPSIPFLFLIIFFMECIRSIQLDPITELSRQIWLNKTMRSTCQRNYFRGKLPCVDLTVVFLVRLKSKSWFINYKLSREGY